MGKWQEVHTHIARLHLVTQAIVMVTELVYHTGMQQHYTLRLTRSTTGIEQAKHILWLTLGLACFHQIILRQTLTQTQELIEIDGYLVLWVLAYLMVVNYNLLQGMTLCQYRHDGVILILLTHKQQLNLSVSHNILSLGR